MRKRRPQSAARAALFSSKCWQGVDGPRSGLGGDRRGIRFHRLLLRPPFGRFFGLLPGVVKLDKTLGGSGRLLSDLSLGGGTGGWRGGFELALQSGMALEQKRL